MRTFLNVGFVAFSIPLFASVCKAETSDVPRSGPGGRSMPSALAENQSDEEAEIAANLAKLGAEDRKLAEAQKFCPIMANNRLGSMGPPTKIVIQDKPVFLCCKGCRKKALAKPEATLAKVEELKAKNAK